MAYEYIEQYADMGFRLTCVPTSQFPPHYHDEFELLYALSGSPCVTLPEQSVTFSAGQCVIINRNALHMYSASYSDLPTVLCMEISPEFCRNYCPQLSDCEITKRLIVPGEYPDFLRAYGDFARAYFSEAYHPRDWTPFELMSRLTALCARMLTDLPTAPLGDAARLGKCPDRERLIAIMDYIMKNHNRKLTLEEVAEQFNLGLYYLSHFLRDKLGMPFQKYLNWIRLNHAVQLLNCNPGIKLTQVCYEAGFSAPKYMQAAFMDGYQCSPGEYRLTLEAHGVPERAQELSGADYVFPYIFHGSYEHMSVKILRLLDEIER